jgi:hypothetical protein
MRQFNTLLATVILLMFAIGCKKEKHEPPIPEPEKWTVTDFDYKASWIKVADNGSKMFILNRFELLTVDEKGTLENRFSFIPYNEAYTMGIGKDVFYWTTYEDEKPYLYIAPNNNPNNKRKLSLDIFNGKKVYPFRFDSGEPDAGYFNSQNQLLYFGGLSDNINPYYYLTIDVSLTVDKQDFVDCKIIDKKEFRFPSWSLAVLKSSRMIDDRIYWADYQSIMRFDNGTVQVVSPFKKEGYGLDIFKWKGKLYAPFMSPDNKELSYSTSDNGVSWTLEPKKDTIFTPKIEVLNEKIVASSNTLSNWRVADDLAHFRKMNTLGLPQSDYSFANFHYFKDYYYVFIDKKVFKIKNL